MILTFDFKTLSLSPPMTTATLDRLPTGTPAAVLAVSHADQPLCLRLQELGLVPGADVEVISRQGGTVLRVGDQRLCLAEGLARSIEVALF